VTHHCILCVCGVFVREGERGGAGGGGGLFVCVCLCVRTHTHTHICTHTNTHNETEVDWVDEVLWRALVFYVCEFATNSTSECVTNSAYGKQK